MGEVQTLPTKVPVDAVHVRLLVTPPVAVAAKVTGPGAKVWFAGVMGVHILLYIFLISLIV